MRELKYRNEYKHIINKNHAVILKSKLKTLLKSDPFANENGEYFIRSLYFDTYDDRALGEKYDGAPFRSKYRIRFYNHDTSVIKLENKIKCYNSTAKLFCDITKEEVYKILAHEIDFLKKSDEPLKRTFYQELAAGALVPKTIVDYIRAPFIYPHGNVRITIDSDIRSPVGKTAIDIFNPNIPTISVFPDERCVLEVKYDDFMPDFIHKLIQVEVTTTSAVSKYASCRRFV
jgi:hypothetical protein